MYYGRKMVYRFHATYETCKRCITVETVEEINVAVANCFGLSTGFILQYWDDEFQDFCEVLNPSDIIEAKKLLVLPVTVARSNSDSEDTLSKDKNINGATSSSVAVTGSSTDLDDALNSDKNER